MESTRYLWTRAGLAGHMAAMLAGSAAGAYMGVSIEAPVILSAVAVGVWMVLIRISLAYWKALKPALGSATALAAVSVAWAALAGVYAAAGSLIDPTLRSIENVAMLCGTAALTPVVAVMLSSPFLLVVGMWRRLSKYRTTTNEA